jgi:1-acyl-sn-glycerol-3-phosphate acyltransferase
MGIGDTLRWARQDWAIFRRDRLGPEQRARWIRQWVPFGARTVGYGALSLTLGPWTADHRASQWAARRWSEASVRALGIRIEAEGVERAPEGSFVYVSNHQSLLDILVLGATLRGDFRWAAKRAVMNVPFLGWHLRLAGHVPVDRRGSKHAAVSVVQRFEAVLRTGKPLLVFPEGTRSDTGELQRFKDGAFYAAVRADVPVVPVALEGTFALMGKHAAETGDEREAERRVVRVRVGDPLRAKPDGDELERVSDLRDRTQAAVAAAVEDLKRRGASGNGEPVGSRQQAQ